MRRLQLVAAFWFPGLRQWLVTPGMEWNAMEVYELNILQGTLNAKTKVKPSPAALLNTAGGAPQPPSPYSIMM